MFQIDIEPFGRFTTRRYYTEDNTISFTIVPERGALLTDYRYNGHPIIDGCSTPEEVEFNAWGKSWLLFPFPNRLKDGKYQWEGETYQFPINEEQNQHALHGFLNECYFEVVSEELTEHHAKIHLRYTYTGERAYYPFPFVFTVTYIVQSDGEFKMECEIINTGKTSLPAALGWHPYFQLGDKINNLWLEMPVVDLVGIDSRMIPTGKRYEFDNYLDSKQINAEVLDNCFQIAGIYVGDEFTKLTDRLLKIEFYQPVEFFPYLQIFTPPARKSIAIEPMSHNIDAFNNQSEQVKIESTQSWWGFFGFKVSSY